MPHPLAEGRTLRKSYGLQTVFEDLSFLISEKQKIALIGRNGAGKSTLLKILLGDETADGGEVHFYPRARVGVVRQHDVLPSEGTALEFLMQESGKESWEVKKQAAAFDLHASHLEQAPGLLSGGYQMRVKLVKMLLDDPNLLILDEPVNYLDLQTLLLLERFLQTFSGAFILAAHDRTFLEQTCTTTYEIEHGKLTTYRGTVSEYLVFKQEQIDLMVKSNKKLGREIRHNQKFVDRFRYKASLATRAQNKLKHIARLRSKIATINSALATTKISIPSPKVPSGNAVRTEDLVIGYGDFVVAQGINLDVNRGEKIAIAGENGRGKSTLLKTLAGVIPSLSGTCKWWHRADIGYYDQHTSKSLRSSDTVLTTLTRMAPAHTSSEGLLMMAGNFLFKGDDLDKSVSVLSGGERARLALAGLLLQEHNVLLLDEPTNHLDVETVEALASALKRYSGTVFVISHARTFINALVDKVYEVRAGSVRRYMGSYEEYVDDLVDAMESSLGQTPADSAPGSSLSSERRTELHTQIREHQRKQERLDKKMRACDKERSEILAYFFENPTDYSPVKTQRLAELDEEMEEHELSWLSAQESIDLCRTELEKGRRE